MSPETRFAILPNAQDGKPTRHRFKESRIVRVKVPILAEPTEEGPDLDENAITGWRTEAATVHIFKCEKTNTERVWGCEAA
jgi:hypothetical protein